MKVGCSVFNRIELNCLLILELASTISNTLATALVSALAPVLASALTSVIVGMFNFCFILE